MRPGYRFIKEPYLTLIGPAIWKNPKLEDLVLPDPDKPGFGVAGIFPVETFEPAAIVEPFKWYNSPKVTPKAYTAKYSTLRPMAALSYRSRLIEMAMSGEHYDVKVDPVSLRRLIAWVDAMGPYRGEEEILAIPDPNFEGVEDLAIRPRMKTAPNISRP